MGKNPKSIRLFIGAVPSQHLLGEFSRHIALMKKSSWSRCVRWVEPDNIHMTLKFMGSINAHRLGDLVAALREQLQFDEIKYRIDRTLLFPSAARPKVIAAQVEHSDRLANLVMNIEQITSQFGVPSSETRFRGHFSLARCGPEFPRNLTFEPLLLQTSETLANITLYHSDTRPSGAVYTSLETISCRNLKNL